MVFAQNPSFAKIIPEKQISIDLETIQKLLTYHYENSITNKKEKIEYENYFSVYKALGFIVDTTFQNELLMLKKTNKLTDEAVVSLLSKYRNLIKRETERFQLLFKQYSAEVTVTKRR